VMKKLLAIHDRRGADTRFLRKPHLVEWTVTSAVPPKSTARARRGMHGGPIDTSNRGRGPVRMPHMHARPRPAPVGRNGPSCMRDPPRHSAERGSPVQRCRRAVSAATRDRPRTRASRSTPAPPRVRSRPAPPARAATTCRRRRP
jgi:hypothetical protein